MNIDSISNGLMCTGCAACSCGCPVNAITMEKNEEGFLYPKVDYVLCLQCEKCLAICPIASPDKYKNFVQDAICYIVQSKNEERKKSASGGVFYTLAFKILELGGIVFGAAFDSDNVVRHVCVKQREDLARLQNSKYVQSDVNETYKEVAEYLRIGKIVLYSGTPCQIAGLYGFLDGREFKKLITIDLICHGVPSPDLLAKELKAESKSWRGKPLKVVFRYKNPFFKSFSSFYMIIAFRYWIPIVRQPKSDPFFNIFLSGYAFRESCYCCKYANPNRISDFTIGDCDSHGLYANFHRFESNSTVMLNTHKAREIWNKYLCKLCDYEILDICHEIKYNKQLGRPFDRPDLRDYIYKDLKRMNWIKFSEKYSKKQTAFEKFRAYCSLILPPLFLRLWGNFRG